MEYKKLSPKEVEVIYLLKKGLSQKDIGGILEIDQQTVSTHVQRIRKKMLLKKGCNAYLIATTYERLWDY